MESFFINSVIAILCYILIVYAIAQVKKDNSIVDIAWGGGFILIALACMYTTPEISPKMWMVFSLLLVWGLRLSVYIYMRSKGRGEDYRYAEFRKSWGTYPWLHALVKVFMLQAVLMLIIAIPIIRIAASVEAQWSYTDIIGFFVWGIGFLFEAVGDYQMFCFKQNPENKGKIFRSGLWKYTRHPNYFGEVVMWWGIFLMSVSEGAVWVSFISPVLLTLLIIKVSGVALLEKKYFGNKEYDDYIKNTNSFFPWFPKQK